MEKIEKNNSNKISIIIICILVGALIIIASLPYTKYFSEEGILNRSMNKSYEEHYMKKIIFESSKNPDLIEDDSFKISVDNLVYNKDTKELSYEVILKDKKNSFKNLNKNNPEVFFQAALCGKDKKVYSYNNTFSKNGRFGNIISKVETDNFLSLENNPIVVDSKKTANDTIVSKCTISNVEDMNNINVYITDLTFGENEKSEYQDYEYRLKLEKNTSEKI